jgi:cytochrome b561
MVTHLVDVAPPARARLPFDTLTIALHWTTLLIVLTLFGSGLLYGQVEARSWAPPLLQAHRSLGVTIWTLTVFRLLWRITGAGFPAFPASMTQLHQLGARLSEYGLYALLLIQPATGLAQTILRGRTFELFAWSIPPLVARNVALVRIASGAHEIGAWCLFALAGLHAAAALVHHFILRDDVLEAMAPAFRRTGAQRLGVNRQGTTTHSNLADSRNQRRHRGNIRDIHWFFPSSKRAAKRAVRSRLDHGANVTVLQNHSSGLPSSPDGNIYHGTGQIVGANYLVGEQHPKDGVDPAQQAVAEIWFLPRFHGVDVRGPEDVSAGEPHRH